MSEHKIPGACSWCDEMCFEVMARWSENERNPGEPKRLGRPTEDAVLVTFLLIDGTRADFTFCGKCAESLNPEQYPEIWRKALRSFLREISETAKPWFNTQFQNGILAEMGRVSWKEKTYG